MRLFKYLFGLSMIILIPFQSLAVAKEQMAVMDLEAKYGVEKGLAVALSEIVRAEIHSFGEYEVLSPGDLEAIAVRKSIQQKVGCDNNDCIV